MNNLSVNHLMIRLVFAEHTYKVYELMVMVTEFQNSFNLPTVDFPCFIKQKAEIT